MRRSPAGRTMLAAPRLGGTRPWVLSLPAAALIVHGCAPAPVPEAFRLSGDHVDVTCDFDCGLVAGEAIDFADGAVRIASRWFGVEPNQVGRLHLVADPDAYEAIEDQITGGRYRENLAFSSAKRRLSVVAVQPPLRQAELVESGLPMQTLRLVAHEVSHLTSYTAMPPPRRIPGWFEEGLAMLVETAVRQELGRIPPDPFDDPLLSTYYVRARRAADEGRLPDLTLLLDDRDGDLTGGEVYAVRAVLLHALADEDPGALASGVQTVVAAHGAGADRAGVREAFIAAFGGMDRIRAVFEQHLAGARPRWLELSRSLETTGSTWPQHPFTSGASAIRTADSGPSWRLDVTVHLKGEDPVAAVTLRNDAGLWGFVQISPDSVHIMSDDPRATLASAALPPAVDPGSPVDLTLEVSDSGVRVTANGVDLETVPTPDALAGPWGLFARTGGWVEWVDLSFGSTAPADRASGDNAPGRGAPVR